MQKVTLLLATAIAIALSGGMALAQSSNAGGAGGVRIVYESPNLANLPSVQVMVENLIADGFIYIEVDRTFLGRARVVAYSTTQIREVVMNATTGEVLRDLVQPGNGTLPAQANPNAQGAGNNGNGNGQGGGQGQGQGQGQGGGQGGGQGQGQGGGQGGGQGQGQGGGQGGGKGRS